MANETKLTSIVIKEGELETGKEQLKQALTELLNQKTGTHYISFRFGDQREFWLKLLADQSQVLYCDKDHLAILPSLKNIIDQAFEKTAHGQVYYYDLDQEARYKKSVSGITAYQSGSPQERLEHAKPIEHVEVKTTEKAKTNWMSFFGRKTEEPKVRASAHREKGPSSDKSNEPKQGL
jgi:hypothetical protein